LRIIFFKNSQQGNFVFNKYAYQDSTGHEVYFKILILSINKL